VPSKGERAIARSLTPLVQDFNWNYGIAQAAEGFYEEAEKALLLITDERHTSDYIFISWCVAPPPNWRGLGATVGGAGWPGATS
jgi:hypothetical protein